MVPSSTLTAAIADIAPGLALDLACGSGRHSIWLQERGWAVTAVDREPGDLPPFIQTVKADLDEDRFQIEPRSWDLILCWLYWQPNLLPQIQGGVRPGGVAALAGKTSGRFATSLDNYREAFPGWTELSAGTNDTIAWLIARKPLS